MIDVPPPHAIGAILLTALMFYGFASGRLKIEIISLLTSSQTITAPSTTASNAITLGRNQ